MTCSNCPARIRTDNQSGLCRACWRAWWREENRLSSRSKQRLYRRAEPERTMLSNAKQRARQQGIEFSITVDDIRIPVRCPFMGIEIRINDGKLGDCSPSLDRIDATRGYIPGNVQVISHKANRAKNNLTPEQLDVFCTAHLERRGYRVTESTIITCPKCGDEGPHERLGSAQDGSHILLRCAVCELQWKVTG